MKLIIFTTILLAPFIINGQGGLFISNGANMVINNSLHIVIENGKFQNDGDFSADGSTVHLIGTNSTENSTIGGSSVTIFNHLNIKKSSNDVRLDYDIDVDGDLIMKEGLFILNKSDVNLGGSIIGETATKRITGTDGGAIIKTVPLNMPTTENPGNIGVEITSTENLGSTTIQRRHVQLTNNGNKSIYRQFDISPNNNFNLDATLRIHYFDEELAGLTENKLKIWQFDGANWDSQNLNSQNTTDNWVEAPEYSFFHTVTVAEEMSGALPIELINFNAIANEKKEVDVFWSTATEINNDYFIVERSKDGATFEKIATVDGAGNSTVTNHYRELDKNPFIGLNYYRLKQVDFDGTQTYSSIRTVNIISDEQFTVFPNPLNDMLHIVGEGFNGEGDLIIEIYDALGKLVYFNQLEMDGQFNTTDINEVSGFAAGNYFLTIKTPSEKYGFNLVKVME